MEDRYYVRFKGRVLGPMSGDKTKELVRRGQITRVHELSPDGIEWRKAEEFIEFYPKKSIVQAVSEEVTEQQKPKQTEVAEWFVHMDGQNQGPVEESGIRVWIASGRVTPDSLVWKDGMTEWLAAELVRPQWFAGRSVAATATTKSGGDSIELLDAISLGLRRQTFWIYFLAIVALFVSGCQVLWCMFALVTQIAAPPNNGNAVLVGLMITFFASLFSAYGLFCGIQVLRYANSVAVLKHAPSEQNVLTATRRLSAIWLLVGIYVLTILIASAVFGTLLYAGSLRALTQFSS